MSTESDALFEKVGEAAVDCWDALDGCEGYAAVGRAALKALMGVNDFGECDCAFSYLDHVDCPCCVFEWSLPAPPRQSYYPYNRYPEMLPGPRCPKFGEALIQNVRAQKSKEPNP